MVSTRHLHKAGFSLIWMSILLTVASVIMVSALPGNEAGDYNAKAIADSKKLMRIEEAMRSFMATNRRRPCPADGQYPVNTQYFGAEAAIAGTCTGGTPAAPLGPDAGTGNIVSGVIPTRSLGLPDEFQFDSYGRRFTYVVDKRATTTATCLALEGITSTSFTPTGTGGLVIKDIAENTLDNTMYAYIQHGPSGYGAWPESGSKTTLTSAQSAASRVNSKSTDKWMQINAGVDVGANPGASTFTYSTANFTSTRYRNSRTFPLTSGGNLDTGFDDFLYYRNDIKNTCCLGPKCIPKGFRVDGNATTGPIGIRAIGDINGDGIPDLIISGTTNYLASKFYVIFGTSTMSGSSSIPWPIPPTGLDPTTLNGTNGFIINSGPGGEAVTVADVNGDGYGDIIIGGYSKGYIIFGGPGGVTTPWLSGGGTTLNVATINGYTGTNGTSGVVLDVSGTGGVLSSANNFISEGIEVGKIDDSGYPAIIDIGYVGGLGKDAGFVIYGKPTSGSGPNGANDNWTSTKTINVAALDGSTGSSLNPGFQFYSTDATLLPLGYSDMPINGVIGDFDDDSFGDIVIGNTNTTTANHNGIPATASGGALFLLYGRSRADWTSAFTTYNGNLTVVDLAAELGATPNRATEFYLDCSGCGQGGVGNYTFTADLNGDSHPDLLISTQLGMAATAIYGKTSDSRWPETLNIYHIASGQGFYFTGTGSPGWLGYFPMFGYGYASAFDVNGDGKLDILLGYGNWTNPISRNGAGAVLVVYQPSTGWPNSMNYNSFKWDGTDSFQIYGPEASSVCSGTTGAYIRGVPWAADVRSGDGGKPEIMVSCSTGEPGHSSIYGLYKNRGWPSSIDLNDLN